MYYYYIYISIHKYYLHFIIIIIVGQSALEIQSNSVKTSETQFCIGDKLVFTCTLTVSAYDWVALPFLNGSTGNGRVLIDSTETVGNITLSASGTGSGRRSTLQVTAFPGLNGVNILCREAGGDPTIYQNVTIRVIGKNNLIGITCIKIIQCKLDQNLIKCHSLLPVECIGECYKLNAQRYCYEF